MPNNELSLIFNIQRIFSGKHLRHLGQLHIPAMAGSGRLARSRVATFLNTNGIQETVSQNKNHPRWDEVSSQNVNGPSAQQATNYTYKNINTLKITVGASPGGLVTYISDSYGGAANDRALVERSNLIMVFYHKDEIMVEKGFNVQYLFDPYDM